MLPDQLFQDVEVMGATSTESIWEAAMCRSPEEAIPDEVPGRWWVAHTKPRNEKALALDLRSWHIAHYLPLQRTSTRSRRTNRITRSIVPVFAGYVFVAGTEEQRLRSLTTNRVAHILPVPAQARLKAELRQIQQALAADSNLEWSDELHVGGWARVIDGPLRDLIGVVVQHLSRFRLVLNVEMLSQSVSVEVPRELLEPLDQSPYSD